MLHAVFHKGQDGGEGHYPRPPEYVAAGHSRNKPSRSSAARRPHLEPESELSRGRCSRPQIPCAHCSSLLVSPDVLSDFHAGSASDDCPPAGGRDSTGQRPAAPQRRFRAAEPLPPSAPDPVIGIVRPQLGQLSTVRRSVHRVSLPTAAKIAASKRKRCSGAFPPLVRATSRHPSERSARRRPRSAVTCSDTQGQVVSPPF